LETDAARAIASAYLLLSCGVVGSALAGIAGAKDATKREIKQRNLLRKKLDMDMISALDEDGDGVDRAEFLVRERKEENMYIYTYRYYIEKEKVGVFVWLLLLLLLFSN
jgi:hypothetical protein